MGISVYYCCGLAYLSKSSTWLSRKIPRTCYKNLQYISCLPYLLLESPIKLVFLPIDLCTRLLPWVNLGEMFTNFSHFFFYGGDSFNLGWNLEMGFRFHNKD